jgi:Tol biopolymer transport system component
MPRLFVQSLVLVVLSAASMSAQSTQVAGGPTTKLPLATTRVARFTTDEGTWLDLDVSPDGRTIVFEMLGDLYTLPVAGGKATRLTDGAAYDAQPRFSPDGKQIVFVSDRDGSENVWLGNADGSNLKMITTGSTNRFQSPEWTPDGRIIVSRGKGGWPAPFGSTGYDQRSYDLYMYDLRGGTGLKLDLTQGTNFFGAAFGKDPRYMYAMAGSTTIGLSYNAWSIVVYDRETGQTTTRVRRSGSAIRPVVSPDNKWLVYATRRDGGEALRIVNLETGDDRLLADSVQHDEQESLPSRDLYPATSFTPDGQSLIIYKTGGIWRLDVATGKMTKIPFTADVELHFAPLERFQYPLGDTMHTVKQIRGARPSPDGKQLVFTALNKLWTMSLPTGTPRRLTNAPAEVGEHSPTWSQDGQSIAYVTWVDEGDDMGGDIYKVSSTGSAPAQPVRLTRTRAFYDVPVYSPDGRRIVATRGQRQVHVEEGYGSSDLIWIPAEGGEATLLVMGGGTPQFTRDSSRVVISQGSELSSVRWDGFDKQTLVKVTAATGLFISPDGDRVLALGGPAPNLYLITLPGVGGITVTMASPAGSPVPVRKITTIGAGYPGWAPDGKSFYYSLGRSFFTVDAANPDTAGGNRTDVRVVVPRDKPKGSVVLRGARLITMKGREIIENGDIVVTDDRIVAIGRSGSAKVPTGARVIDVKGKTIIPGYVDTHAHLRGGGGVLRNNNWSYMAALAYGVTTARDPSTGTDVFAYEDLIESGNVMGPRLFDTGPALQDQQNIRSLEDARNIITRYRDYYGTNYIKQYGPGERKARQWLMMAAREKRVTAVTEPYMDVVKDVNDALDGYHEMGHGWPIFPIYKDLVTLIAETKMTHTATLTTTFGGPTVFAEEYFYYRRNFHDDPKLRRFTPHEQVDQRALRRSNWYAENQFVFKQQAEGIKKMIDAGGLVAIGGHGNFQGMGYHWEMEMHTMGGVPARDVLRAATINGAISLGLDKDIGSLEVGKLADLQVLDRNPINDIQNTLSIRYVMKNGRLYEGNTLNEIWPRMRKVPKQWWWDQRD